MMMLLRRYMTMGQDNFDGDDSFSFQIMIVVALILFFVVMLSFKRRGTLAPRVCPIICEYDKSEKYYAWEMTDWGIRCICKGKLRSKKTARGLP